MKKKDLEIILQKIPPNPSPIVKLEQYPTPANIAADIIFNAYLDEDIADRTVLDLGCGTGVFALGAKLLSADKVFGVDIDGTALAIASGYANALSLDISFIEHDVAKLSNKELSDFKIDTVFQNPPFGAQKSARGADRVFIQKALEFADVVYSLHLSRTEDFISLLTTKLGASIKWKKQYLFPIAHLFDFHSKEKVNYDVTLFKIENHAKK
jgi:putative methylase